MKTTLVIDDRLMERLRKEAARRGTTISELVESAIRTLLGTRAPRRELPRLPTFKASLLVDLAKRDALYDAMEGR
jgi:hypothetical protein